VASDAATRDVLVIAARIVRGDMEPYAGARAIWARMTEEFDEYPEEIRPFVGMASEIEDHPEQRDAYEADILEEARALLTRHGLPAGG
jgi:hypothetical protein